MSIPSSFARRGSTPRSSSPRGREGMLEIRVKPRSPSPFPAKAEPGCSSPAEGGGQEGSGKDGRFDVSLSPAAASPQ